MSIFPKRTVAGQGVTIHWNFNTAHLKGVHIFPWVRIGVKDPAGRITMLFEDHLLALPDEAPPAAPATERTSPKFLKKSTPLLVLADYLSGPASRETLVGILSALQSGRHFYFHFPVPPDAIPGKYELISEVHSDGFVRYSKTASEDFFYVEKITVKADRDASGNFVSTILNGSPEETPVKIVRCVRTPEGLKTRSEAFAIPGGGQVTMPDDDDQRWLLYNEERITLPLGPCDCFLLRNQQLLHLSKQNAAGEAACHVLRKDSDEAVTLDGVARDVWQSADGLLPEQSVAGDRQEALGELLEAGLIQTIRFGR